MVKSAAVGVLLVGALNACSGKSSTGGSPTVPTSPASAPFTVSGRVTEYRGGPIAGAHIGTIADPTLPLDTTSDADGHYRLAVPSLQWGLPQGGLFLWVDAPGYLWATKSVLRAVDQSFDVALDRLMTLQRNQPVTATIWGDELLPGDNPGRGACTPTACKVFEIDKCGEPLTIRLQWSDPTAELALYLPRGELSIDRYCCRSEIVVPYSPPAVDCDSALWVGFERRAGTRPAAADSVQFTLVESASTIDASARGGLHGREPRTTDRGPSPRGSQRQTTFPRR